MTSNEPCRRGWPAAKQYAACFGGCAVFALGLITFVCTQSPPTWERSTFSSRFYTPPSAFERALAARADDAHAVATAETATPASP